MIEVKNAEDILKKAVKEGQTVEHLDGFVYEIKNEDGKRVRVFNILVEEAMMANESLRYLRYYHRNMYSIQKLRIAAGNAEDALVRQGVSELETKFMRETFHKGLKRLEGQLERRCLKHLETFDIWNEYLEKIRGIGTRLGASLVSIIATPKRFENNTALYMFAGVASIDGKIQKKKKGETANWSHELKVTLYKLTEQWVKQGEGYRKLYDQFKERETESNLQRPKEEQLSKKHIDTRTRRRTVKLFLSHFLQRWRELENLPVRKPYPIEYLGHTTIIPPFVDKGGEIGE